MIHKELIMVLVLCCVSYKSMWKSLVALIRLYHICLTELKMTSDKVSPDSFESN